MIFNENLQKVISNLGWVDKGSIWVYDGIKSKNDVIRLSDSQYLTLAEGKEEYFSIVHHGNNSEIDITVHNVNDPRKEYFRTSFNHFNTSFSGDASFLEFVPKYYVCGFTMDNDFAFHLLKIEGGIIVLEDHKIEWYTKGDFDFMYQGLTSVTEYGDELIFTVQRDGSLYRYSLNEDKLIDKIKLSGKYGNPQPTIKNDEIWVSDYDTILRLKNWNIERVKKLQESAKGTAQFIGNFSFNAQNNLCIIARPFSGDVIGLNKNLKIKYTCNIGNQPLEAVLMQDNTVIARDWQTGKLLQGEMKRKWF
ncbi:MAG: hypothetical protein ACTHMI_10410 [Mucilaginibacter sp.]